MVRFSNIVLAYLMIGAVMWAGGAVAWGDAGINQFFIDQSSDGTIEATQGPQEELGGVGSTIQNVIASFGAPLVLIWNLVTGIISWLNWPLAVLVSVNAPPRITVLVGGPMTAAFYLSIIRVVRTSA